MKIIYLDLDGVINSLSKRPPKNNTGWEGEWHEKRIEGYRILWSAELIDALNTLSAREDVTIKFLTTWRNLAPSSFGPQVGLLGSTQWPYFSVDDSELWARDHWWKLDQIKTDIEIEKPEKAVWLDDDINFERGARQWLDEQDASILAIAPESTFGLTRKHIELIEEFLDADLVVLESEGDSVTVE